MDDDGEVMDDDRRFEDPPGVPDSSDIGSLSGAGAVDSVAPLLGAGAEALDCGCPSPWNSFGNTGLPDRDMVIGVASVGVVDGVGCGGWQSARRAVRHAPGA
jgi:hypothetical protein